MLDREYFATMSERQQAFQIEAYERNLRIAGDENHYRPIREFTILLGFQFEDRIGNVHRVDGINRKKQILWTRIVNTKVKRLDMWTFNHSVRIPKQK